MTSHRRFDVIILGVTGMLGQYTCEQFARKGIKRSIKWAVAARNKKKISNVLRKVSVEVGRDLELTPKFEADCSDPASLTKICKECKVLVNCVGPYVDYGEYVVKACLETGTHYIDACVEPYFLEDIQCRYSREANSKNVFIIQSCGFSTLLFELGLLCTIAKFDGAINSCEMFTKVLFSRYGHRLNFSIFRTIVAIIENNVRYSRVSSRLKREMFPKTSEIRYGLPIRSRIFTEAYRSVVSGYCLNVRSGELSTLQRTQMWLQEKDDLKPIQFLMQAMVQQDNKY
ncbi:hypothetical protein B4U80_02459 [Leptotrombidium deliense]|uniref:Saccharopine dehydrogenase NADP binding domain-containing protein n=1 Tax=Leptotrombidium deliense TaxID=299467 RepID=A0A443SJC2_9ACAR|nr:hypothetical protein B4U80_02459 [Leptotrombidium deliense]